jgi:hypothetical protein
MRVAMMRYGSDGIRKKYFRRIMSSFVIIFLFIATFMCSGTAKSSGSSLFDLPSEYTEDLPDPGTAPDSWLYGLKRTMENIDLFFTFDEASKVEKLEEIAQIRLSEAQKMANEGKTEYVDDLIYDYNSLIEESTGLLKQLNQSGSNISHLIRHSVIARFSHQEVLEGLVEEVPLQSYHSFQHLLNHTLDQFNETMSILSYDQPDAAAEIHLRLAQKKLLETQFQLNGNESEQVKMVIRQVQSIVNESRNLVKQAKSRGIDTFSVEELISNLSSHLDVNYSNDENYSLDDLYDLLPSEVTQYLNGNKNISVSDIEDVLTFIDSISSGLLSENSEMADLFNLSSKEELGHQISSFLKKGSTN